MEIFGGSLPPKAKKDKLRTPARQDGGGARQIKRRCGHDEFCHLRSPSVPCSPAITELVPSTNSDAAAL
jgi:hypothetical protein